MRELIDSQRYETRDDFTVVLQPFMRELHLPMTEVRRPPPDAFPATSSSTRVRPSPSFLPLIEERPPRSLLLHARLFPSQPEGSHPHGSRSLEQHGRICSHIVHPKPFASLLIVTHRPSLSWSQWATRLSRRTLKPASS